MSQTAHQLGRLGDDSPLDERRARALGLLAHPQETLDLLTHPTEPTDHAPTTSAPGPGRVWREWPPDGTTGATIYLHIDAEDLRRHTETDDPAPGTLEKLGTATLEHLSTWLHRCSQITIKPVLDMNRATSCADAVDAARPTGLDA